jgi:hypothetical protein
MQGPGQRSDDCAKPSSAACRASIKGADGATNCGVEKVKDVKLPGFEGEVEWTQHDKGLRLKMPDSKPCDRLIALKIIGAWAARRAAARLGRP